jgi:hypothetical protein
LRKWFSSQDQDDEQFRLEPMSYVQITRESQVKGHIWITYCLRIVSYLIGTRVVIRPEGCFFTRILTVDLP